MKKKQENSYSNISPSIPLALENESTQELQLSESALPLDSGDTKEKMFADWLAGMTLKEIADQNAISYQTILRYKKKGDWENRKSLALVEMKELQEGLPKAILQEETINDTLRVLHRLVQEIKEGMFLNRWEKMPINVKSLVDSINTLFRLQTFLDSGGVDRKEVNVKKQSIDWNRLIESSVKLKQGLGDQFDEKQFIKQVLDGESDKNNK